MARGRMISKSLSTSRRFARLAVDAGALGEFAQSLFPLVVAHADDFGRLSGDAFTVKHLCHPTSKRSVTQFDTALSVMEKVGLIARSDEGGVNRIQVNSFEEHQVGLHKRSSSKFPEVPGNSGGFPLNLTEGKGTEQKGTEGNRASATAASGLSGSRSNGSGTTRSKRPIFTGQRLTVFEWMLDDLSKLLGSHTDSFDLHEWFFTLDAKASRDGLVIPQRDNGAWLQAQTLNEAKRRGLPIASAGSAVVSDQTVKNIAAMHGAIARIQGTDPS